VAHPLAHAHKRIKLYLKYDKSTPQGKAFDAEMKGDDFWDTMKHPPMHFPKMVKNLESMLRRPEFVPVEKEWQALRNRNPKKKEDPHWFSLFGGPTSVRALATHLNKRGYYEFLYRYWSDAIHAGSVMTQLKPIKIGERLHPIILPLRNPSELVTCGSVAIGFCLMVGHAVVEKYIPSHMTRFASRYAAEVQRRYMALSQAGPLIDLPW